MSHVLGWFGTCGVPNSAAELGATEIPSDGDQEGPGGAPLASRPKLAVVQSG